jgi:hypothetical protein
MFNKLTEIYINRKIKRLRKDDKLFESKIKLRDGCVLANHKKLNHIKLCAGELPEYYVDKPFTCRDCDSKNVWTAAKQKHYFEELKGKHLEALAIRCRKCRELRNINKNLQVKMSKINPHPNELFFRNLEEYNKK